MHKSIGVFSLVGLGFVLGSWAEPMVSQPFQASLTPDIAVHDRTTKIEGLSLSVWGENPQSALSLGFVNGSTGESSGVSLGFFGNYAERYTGLQLGTVNYAGQSVSGLQCGFLNYAGESLKGGQLGCVNCAGAMSGLQVGFVNYAKSAESGIQIGVVNVILENQVWFSKMPGEVAPAMIFVNWTF
jgi:hypothetical protein